MFFMVRAACGDYQAHVQHPGLTLGMKGYQIIFLFSFIWWNCFYYNHLPITTLIEVQLIYYRKLFLIPSFPSFKVLGFGAEVGDNGEWISVGYSRCPDIGGTYFIVRK